MPSTSIRKCDSRLPAPLIVHASTNWFTKHGALPTSIVFLMVRLAGIEPATLGLEGPFRGETIRPHRAPSAAIQDVSTSLRLKLVPVATDGVGWVWQSPGKVIRYFGGWACSSEISARCRHGASSSRPWLMRTGPRAPRNGPIAWLFRLADPAKLGACGDRLRGAGPYRVFRGGRRSGCSDRPGRARRRSTPRCYRWATERTGTRGPAWRRMLRRRCWSRGNCHSERRSR